MTIGSDSSSVVTHTVPGFPLWGAIFTAHHVKNKVWNGADTAPVAKPPKQYENRIIPGRWTLGSKKHPSVWLPAIHYRKRVMGTLPKRAGRKPEHNYSCSGYDTQEDPLIYHYAGYYSGLGYESLINSSANPDASNALWSSNDDLALISKLRSNIAGSDFNAGVALAELPRALKLLADSATRIRRAYTSVRRGDIAGVVRALALDPKVRTKLSIPRTEKQSAKSWLELQYGWKPLVQDAADCAIFVEHNFNYPRQWVVSAKRFAGGTVDHLSDDLYGNYPGVDLRYMQNRTYSKKIRAIIQDVDTLAMSGLLDPAGVAWEILPYSFVADWFIPIGTYLDALRIQRSVNATYVTTVRKTVTMFAPYPVVKPGWDPSQFSWYSKAKLWRAFAYSFSRTFASSLSIPLPSVKPLHKSATAGHAANAIALLVSRHGSR